MENIAEKTFAELKEDISTYVELRLELLKLNTYERVAKTMAVFSYGIVLVLLAFFAILFLFLALGFFLGELLGSMALGFVWWWDVPVVVRDNDVFQEKDHVQGDERDYNSNDE
ncbi:MAG: hypothetical protein ACLU4N_13330 [Butyricimonas faecihominis]